MYVAKGLQGTFSPLLNIEHKQWNKQNLSSRVFTSVPTWTGIMYIHNVLDPKYLANGILKSIIFSVYFCFINVPYFKILKTIICSLPCV